MVDAPTKVAVIGVKVPDGTENEYVIVRNLTRGGQMTAQLRADKKAVFNRAPTTAWQDDDIIQGEFRGRRQGVQQETIKNGKAEIQITTTADTTTPGVSL